MLCKQCGTNSEDQARFCTVCGSSLSPVTGMEPLDETQSAVDAFFDENVPPEDSAIAAEYELFTDAPDYVPLADADVNLFDVPPDSSNPEEDTVVFYAPSNLSPEPEPERPMYAPLPESESHEPLYAPSVIVQSTATILRDAQENAARPASPPPSGWTETRGRRVGRTLWTCFLTLAFFTAATTALLLACLQGTLSQENLPGLAERVDWESLLDNQNVSETILNGLDPGTVGALDIRERDIRKLLASPEVRAFAVEQLSACLKALSQGNIHYTLDADVILNFVRENDDLIRSKLGYRMNEADYLRLEDALADPETEELLNVGKALSLTELDAGWLDFLLSEVSLVALLSLCGILLLLLFIVNRRRIATAFLCAGIPLLLDGLLFTALGLALRIILSGLLEDTGLTALSGLASPLRSALTYSGLIVFAAGLFGTGLFFLSRRRKPRVEQT